MLQNRADSSRASRGADAPGRISGEGPVGVVDIGSNSVRLVVYERLSRSPTPLFNEKVLCGLGRGLAETGRLSDDSVTQALGALRRFRAISDQIGVTRLDVLATAAAREAENGADFVSGVTDVCGVAPIILAGKDEARIAALGIASGTEHPDGVVGDMGGGSLELVEVKGGEIGEGATFPLGGLRLQDLSGESVKKARRIAREALAASPQLEAMTGRAFYAIGGTWRSLARLHMRQRGYPLHVMHHYAVEAADMGDFARTVMVQPLETLEGIDVVSKNRRALLPYGAAVITELVKGGKPAKVVFSALGLREGHLFDVLSEEERAKDPLIEAAWELGYLRSRSPEHGEELVALTETLMQSLDIDETEEEQRLRTAACLLADIGWRAHPDYRGEQSLNLIAHAAFVGIDHPGRAYLALTVFYRYAGLVDEGLSPRIRELAPYRYRERARALGAALRFAYQLSAAMPGVLPRLGVDREEDERLVVTLPGDLADLDGQKVRSRLKQLAGLGGLSSDVRISSSDA